MGISQKRSKRKASGARYKRALAKKQHELGSKPTLTGLSKLKTKTIRVLGGKTKSRVLRTDIVNVLDPKTKKHKIVKIKQVVENPANHNYVRRNIFNKGAILETELGKAKVTSRPGQEGSVNAVLIS